MGYLNSDTIYIDNDPNGNGIQITFSTFCLKEGLRLTDPSAVPPGCRSLPMVRTFLMMPWSPFSEIL